MHRRGVLAALAIACLAATAAFASAQPIPGAPDLPPVPDRNTVIEVEVPVDAHGAGGRDLPVPQGVLRLEVQPLALMGADGTSIDTGASIVRATLIDGSGGQVVLPAIVIAHPPLPLPPEAAQAIADAQAAADDLASQVEDLAPDDDPEGQADDAKAEAEDQVEALRLEVAWIEGLLEAAATAGEDQVAIAAASLDEAIAATALFADDLARAATEASGFGMASAEAFAAAARATERLEASEVAAAQAIAAASSPGVLRNADKPLKAAGAGAATGLFVATNSLAFAMAQAPAAGEAWRLSDEANKTIPAALAWALPWAEHVQAQASGQSAAMAAAAILNIEAAQRSAQELGDLTRDASATQAFALAARLAGDLQAAHDELSAVVPVPVPGSPLSTADRVVCLATSVTACFDYDALDDDPSQAVRVAVAVPTLPDVPVPDVPGVPDVPDTPGIPPTPSLTGTPSGLPSVPGLPSGSSSSSSSSAASSTSSSSSSSSSTSSSGSSAPAPHLVMSVDKADLDLRMGEQGALVLTVRNDGDAADTVHVTADGDAPVAAEADTGSFALAAGASRDVTLRLTPHAAGSGLLRLLASGDKAPTIARSVAIDVAAAAPATAAITASLEPSSLAASTGQRLPVIVTLRNDATVADTVTIAASSTGLDVDPASQQVSLQPGESSARQVWFTAPAAGQHQVSMVITSVLGADLRPIVLFDASDARPDDVPHGDDATPPSSKVGSKGSPGAGVLLSLAALAAAAIVIRRRLGK